MHSHFALGAFLIGMAVFFVITMIAALAAAVSGRSFRLGFWLGVALMAALALFASVCLTAGLALV